MFKLLKYMKKYWYIAIFAPIFMILEVAMDLVLSIYMQKMVDFGIQTGNFENVVKYGLIMIGILILGVAGGMLSNVFTNISCYKFGNDLRKATYEKIMNLSLSQTDDFKTGSLVTRVTNDITQVQQMVSMCLRGLIRAFSFFVLGIIFTLSISQEFGMILVILLPLEVGILLLFMKIIFPVFTIIQKKLDKVNQVVLENVTGARVVKAFSKEDYEYDRFKEANDDLTATTLRISKLSAFLNPLIQLIVFFGQVVIYYIGGNSILNAYKNNSGEFLMVGQISQAITYISMICNSVIMIGMLFTFMARAYASSKRINEILDTKNEIIDGDLDVSSLKEKGHIVFDNVCFRYPDDSSYVLSNLSFEINKGETIAIVGATGCGKSSLVNLLVRFFDINEGNIYIDGEDIRRYKKIDLRNKISMCLQKAELFAGTIKENIAFGKLDATDEEVIEASKIAQAEEFILSKENGYDELVLEKGASLSGGQKQRLSIARAIVRKPEFLVFDDSTSALDLVTEAKLYDALNKKMKDVTKIVVAQRIATVKNADRIMVLENGRIVDFDTHEHLMDNCQIYKDIYTSQLKKEEI